jgi:hypothetical protein
VLENDIMKVNGSGLTSVEAHKRPESVKVFCLQQMHARIHDAVFFFTGHAGCGSSGLAAALGFADGGPSPLRRVLPFAANNNRSILPFSSGFGNRPMLAEARPAEPHAHEFLKVMLMTV